MVATNAIAKSLTTVAGLLSLTLSASASPVGFSITQALEIKSSDFYHFKTVPPDPANNVTEQMANEQALSLAKFEGNHEAKYFWFLEKNLAFQNTGGPGTGCQVGLYFDNMLERIKKGMGLDWNYSATDKVEDKWAVAGGITPWCSATFLPKDNAEYKHSDLGFISTRPLQENDPSAFVMMTYLRSEGQGQDDTMIADQMNIIWSEGMLDYLNDRYPGAEAKFKAAVNATYNPIVNPYKYGKADPIWSKVKPDNLFKGQ